MKIHIYQIAPERDENRVCFMSLESTRKFQQDYEIDAAIYNKVYSGDVNCQNLEEVYRKFNLERPKDYHGRSLSVSDVVEVEDAATITPGYYFCDSIGFREIFFQPQLAKDSTETELLQVVLLEPGKQARITQIPHTLEAMQGIVGGSIEAFYPFAEDVCIVCNEEGKLNGLPLNRAIREEDSGEIVDIIAGTCFLCDCSGSSFASLSPEQQQRFLQKYQNPELFFRKGNQIESIPYKSQKADRER